MVVLPKVTLLGCFFSPLLDLLWQREPDLPYAQVLLPSLSVAASLFVLRCNFCSLCSPKEKKKKTGLPHSRSIHVPNLCNNFRLWYRDACRKPRASGRGEKTTQKKWVHNKKIGEAKQVLTEKGLKAEEQGRAPSGVLPSIVLLPSWARCAWAQATVRLS